MMSRYYPPPQFEGRPLNFGKLGKGKRHYWGQKGKSYGLYTSGQQKDMESFRHNHRRIKSQMHNYENEPNPQSMKRRATQILHQSAKKKDYAEEGYHRIYTQTGIQSQQIFLQRKQMGTSTPLAAVSIKQRLQDYVSNRKEQNNQRSGQARDSLENRSFLPKINERRNTTQQIQELNQRSYSRNQNGDRIQQSKIDNVTKNPVIFYRRKSRLDNPTFCNSFGYPLACHRYI